MSFAKQARRTIVVDGQRYHWMVKSVWDGVTLSIQLADSEGAKLRLGFDRIAAFMRGEEISIQPALVKDVILAALEDGWKPQEKGPMFLANYLHLASPALLSPGVVSMTRKD